MKKHFYLAHLKKEWSIVWTIFTKLYALVVFFMEKHFSINLPGLGFILRRIKIDHTINVQGRRYYFYSKAASMYSLLIVGKFPEPETHLFFSKIIPRTNTKIGFIDVGAAVGEMVIDVAGYENIDNIIAFEPDMNLAKSCRLSAAINEYDNVTIIPKAVADKIKTVNFRFAKGRGISGSISEKEDNGTEKIVCTTLDNEIQPRSDLEYLVLIDVEGAEPLVLKGGTEFIKRKLPLIIFEYNSGKNCRLSEITAILGLHYEIYRLRNDGHLDSNFDKAWNCVAVCKDSVFHPICQSIILK